MILFRESEEIGKGLMPTTIMLAQRTLSVTIEKGDLFGSGQK